MHCMTTLLLLLFPFYSHDILPLLDQWWVTGGEETRRRKHTLSLYSSFPWYDYRSTCNLLGSRWRSDGSLPSCSDTRDNKEETTLLAAFPTLKSSSGPEHDSRQQQIDTQNTGILARQMDCGQEPEVGNKYLSHPVKHLQVAFKRGGQRGYSVSAGKVLDVDRKALTALTWRSTENWWMNIISAALTLASLLCFERRGFMKAWHVRRFLSWW